MSTTQPKIPHRPPRTPDRKISSRPPRTTPKTWHTVIDPQQGQPRHSHHHHHNHQYHHHHQHHHLPQQHLHNQHPHNSNQNHPPAADADNRSRGSGASADSHATPTSVVLRGGPPLTRDLSDLSGSYMGGNTMNYRGRTPSPSGVPVHVYPSDQSDTSYQRPWRHAHVLSSRGPLHPQPPMDDDTRSIDIIIKKSRVMVGPQGLVEVVAFRGDDSMASDSIDSVLAGSLPGKRTTNQQRFPLLILLMDPHRKIYELEQLWIDVETDTVRDVLHAVQLSLSDRWRQDYDGLFQVRNQTFNQLIHILNVEKYGVQPLEVWVAKPWAMSAKATIQYADSLLQHLTSLKIVAYHTTKDYPHTKAYNPSSGSSVAVKDTEAILTFTSDAASRMYVPGGAVLRHHHAHQFVGFAPPFEKHPQVDVIAAGTINTSADDVASMISDIQNSSIGSCGDSIEERRAVSPLSRTPDTSIRDAEISVINEVISQMSDEPQQKQQEQHHHPQPQPCPAPIVQRPKPIFPTGSRTVATTAATPETTATQRCREQAKIIEEPRRSRMAMLFCCRKERDIEAELRRNDGIQRNDTLETVPEWKPYWEDGAASVGSAISDSRPLLLRGDMHIVGRGGGGTTSTRSDWC